MILAQKGLEGPGCFREWVSDPDGMAVFLGDSFQFVDLRKDG